jgi:predicted ferric reductase
VALVLLMITSIWRRALRIPYQVWHVLHSVLGGTIVLAGLVHAFLVDHWLSAPWVRAVWIGYAAAFLWLAVWVRLVRPLRLWRRPWRVVELWPEPGGSVTVGLEPRHRHGGPPWSFTAGQFAWILPGRVPFTPTYHPFSISSSALRPRVEFTIKPVGDFTRSIRRLRVGDTVYVDGPHGSFTLERHPGMGYVLLATGVGVTPFLSMLATLADQGDRRPVWLFLGNSSEDRITGIRQLERLRGRLDLTVVHVISRASEAWPGERGRIDAALLARHLPPHARSLQYFVCSREETVRAVRASLAELGVPADRVHSEQFGMV